MTIGPDPITSTDFRSSRFGTPHPRLLALRLVPGLALRLVLRPPVPLLPRHRERSSMAQK
jgi:hypothetical protein